MKALNKIRSAKFWLVLLAELLVAMAIYFALSSWQERGMLSSNSGVPVLKAHMLNGEILQFPLRPLSSDRTLIYFYAPWCKICHLSIGNLNILRNQVNETELDIIIVALDWASKTEVELYMQQHELNFPVILGDIHWQQQYKIKGFPTYYILNDKAEIISRSIGYSSSIGMLGRVKLGL